MNFLAALNVKQKVFAGFGIMLTVVFAVAVSALISLSSTETDVVVISDDIQPAVLAASELQYHIERANSSLGFYLLSQEQTHKDIYLESLAKVDVVLGKLQNLRMVRDQRLLREHVSEIASGVHQFKQYRDRVLTLAESRDENLPGVRYAAVNLSPLAQQMLSYMSIMIQAEVEEEVSAKRRKLLIDIEEMRYSFASIVNGVRAYLAFKSQSSLAEIRLYTESMQAAINRIKANANLLTLDQADALEQFVAQQSRFSEQLNEMIKIHSSDKSRMDSYLIRTEIGPLVNEIGKHVDSMVDSLRDQASSTSKALASQVGKTISLVGVLLFVGVLVGLAGAIFISRAIVSPLAETKAAMEDIASGNGDLTKRIDIKGNDEIAQLANAFNHFASKVQVIVKEVSGITSRLASASERLTVVTEETRKGADRQLQETDEVAIAVNEMAASGQEVARNANAAADAAHNADVAADNGRQVVGHTIEAIDSLAREVTQAGIVIDRVEKDSESIGGVLDVIKGIAEQTNLLALNAAIEAARAGEQGRGFAVVADEVRTLASRTQQSTAEIQTMIERLQTGTRDAVSVMDQSRQMAEATVGQAARAGTSLEEINAAVATIKNLNSQIACSAEEQSTVAEEINQKVVRISDITDQTAAGAQQTASASNELNQLAETLKLLVGQFKV
ncbi:MAG TPA: methyl-accepting chemotaxis protein [Gammaproteobacteria bacterium]